MSIYEKILWFLGFQEGEYISTMLARQKQRLGWVWWFMPIITILFTICLVSIEIWTVIHIATFEIKQKIMGRSI